MFKPEVIPFVPQTHYETLATWWEGHKWPVIPQSFLPSVGFIVEDVAAGFIYSTDSNLAILEWIVSNPTASPMKIYPAIEAVVAALKHHAHENGYIAIFSFIKNDGLLKIFNKNGFKVTDTGMTHVLFTEG